jgi:hypothetical protein
MLSYLKRPLIWYVLLLAALLVIGFSIPSLAQAECPLQGKADQPLLARLDRPDIAQRLDLPTYAHLQDAAGQEYVLVIAPRSSLDRAGPPYRALETAARGSDYVIARERRPGARAQAPAHVVVLLDDGRQIVARATPAQVETLLALGFDVQRLSDRPLVWRKPPTLPVPETITPDPRVADMIAQVQQSSVYTYTGQLSGEWAAVIRGIPYTILTRHTASGTPIQKATQMMAERMQMLGLTVSYQDWNAGGYSGRNVIGEKRGLMRPGEIVLITAHLDDMPSGPRAPGADDNGSGSVGVWTAAEILGKYDFERTVRFVFFTGEEQGLLGSEAYAELVYNAGENIVGVYNMDMIAYDGTDGPTLRLHTRTPGNPGYSADLAIANLFTDVVSAYGLSGSLTPILDPDGITASDHASFWDRGYPAILAIEDDVSDFNPRYHTTGDRLQYLNMTYYTNYVKASVGTAAHLAYPLTIVYAPLALGWNLIAIPLVPANPAPAAVLTSVTGKYDLVYAYDACDTADPWKVYDPAAPPWVNDLTQMDVRHGYWLRDTTPATLMLTGTPPGPTSITLCVSWNLIGYPSTAAVPLPDALASIAGKYDLVYAYDASDPTDPWRKYDPLAPPWVNTLAEMGPGKGYWLRMTEAATLTVVNP